MFVAKEIMEGRRDSIRDRKLKKWLRTLSDDERFAFILECLDYRGYSLECFALELATSCIFRKGDAHKIFRKGMVNPDASSIKFWLEFAIKKLGARTVVEKVASELDSNPDFVDKAVYWLPIILPDTETRQREKVKDLIRIAKKRGILRGPVINRNSDGTVLFSNIYKEKS